ncbi:MAG: ATP-binding protein [Opitutaceae bacterium]|nr:ATP-binding protein [Opitutaceae bacterium]
MRKLRVFVSSVQKELELERAAVATVISTDPFLQKHCDPLLFEQEPPPPHPAPRPYLEALRSSQIYVLIIAHEYGAPDGDLSATHHEYRLAQERKLPTLVFLKDQSGGSRHPQTDALILEIKNAHHTYKRFHDREDLKPLLQRALLRILQEDFSISASVAEAAEGVHLIDIASAFEARVLPDVPATSFQSRWVDQFALKILPKPEAAIWDGLSGYALATRGLATFDPDKKIYHATVAALLIFGQRPADHFPQAEILLDAYDQDRVTGKPKGQLTLNTGLPDAITVALKFIDDHTFHPRRVVGVNNLRLDEYPSRALREALVNATAHRSYDDGARKIFVRVFSDRVEIASPGYPPKPLTLAKLRRGDYRPASRNPLIAQTLATLELMEQRGSGFARMRDAMLDHGLTEPAYSEQDGYFVVTFTGPNGEYDRLKLPPGTTGLITPAVEAQLNRRQKRIMIEVQKSSSVTSGWCKKIFRVTYNTTYRDLSDLVARGLLVQVGEGRGTHYRLKVGPV